MFTLYTQILKPQAEMRVLRCLRTPFQGCKAREKPEKMVLPKRLTGSTVAFKWFQMCVGPVTA